MLSDIGKYLSRIC